MSLLPLARRTKADGHNRIRSPRLITFKFQQCLLCILIVVEFNNVGPIALSSVFAQQIKTNATHRSIGIHEIAQLLFAIEIAWKVSNYQHALITGRRRIQRDAVLYQNIAVFVTSNASRSCQSLQTLFQLHGSISGASQVMVRDKNDTSALTELSSEAHEGTECFTCGTHVGNIQVSCVKNGKATACLIHG